MLQDGYQLNFMANRSMKCLHCEDDDDYGVYLVTKSVEDCSNVNFFKDKFRTITCLFCPRCGSEVDVYRKRS